MDMRKNSIEPFGSLMNPFRIDIGRRPSTQIVNLPAIKQKLWMENGKKNKEIVQNMNK